MTDAITHAERHGLAGSLTPPVRPRQSRSDSCGAGQSGMKILELFGLFLAFAWITGCFGTALWIGWKVKAPLPPADPARAAAEFDARAAAEAQAMMGIGRK